MKVSRMRLAVLLAGAVAIGTAVAGGVAFAQAGGGEIHACVKSGGALVVADSCSRNQTPLVWNVQGPPGAAGAKGDTGATGATGGPGPKGDTGARGPAGLSGYEVVTFPYTLEPGIAVIVQLPCPAGKRAISGGWETDNNAVYLTMYQTGPWLGGHGWRGAIYNKEGATTVVTMMMVCAYVDGAAPAALRRAGAAKAPTVQVIRP